MLFHIASLLFCFLVCNWQHCIVFIAQTFRVHNVAWLAASAMVIAASAMTASSKWAILGTKWCQTFCIAEDQPHLGSWIDVRLQPWGVGCKVCAETKVSSPWASYSVEGQLQKATFRKHHHSKKHCSAVKTWLKNGGCFGPGPSPSSAPSLEEFHEFIQKFDSTTSLTRKQLHMAWCVAEGVKALDQRFIAKASHIALMRDERHGRIAIRYRAVAPDLTVRSGFLGQSRQAGTGSDNVSKATWEVMKRACSRFQAAPDGKTGGYLKAGLFKHLQERIVAFCADSAADEMASCEVMRSAELSLAEANRAMLPNLQNVFRDRAHASRRLTSRPWNADEKLKEVMDYMCRGPSSMARLINDSMELKRVFGDYCRSSESQVHSAISCFRAAGHRFESYAKPLGRTCLFFHACIRTACHLVRSRSDASAKKAKQWLSWISEEHVLQAAMLADAADSSLAFTRTLDTEDADPAVLKGELSLYLKEIQCLFGEGKCLTCFGYTSSMCELLKSPIVFQLGKDMKSLGSSQGVAPETVDICLGRMRAWLKLAASAIEAEFPHFEITQAYDIFHLRGVSQKPGAVDLQLKTLAHTFKVDFNILKAQWQDLYPRAQLEFKAQLGCLSDKMSKDIFRDANKEAWKLTIGRYRSGIQAKSHPTETLQAVLLNYFVCTPSTSGIEQNFSKGQMKYSKQRHHALPMHEELVLKLFCDLPNLCVTEVDEVCKLARVCWASQYGEPRARSTDQSRSDKGLKRKSQPANENCSFTESSFLKRRRSAAAAAAESHSGIASDLEPQFWTDKHEKEKSFLEKKQLSRKIQAVAESSLPNATEHDQAAAEASKKKILVNHQNRRAQTVKFLRNNSKKRALVLAEMRGSKVFMAVPANIDLQASFANHGMQLTHDPLQASVLICDKPGEGTSRMQLLVGLRGLREVCPSFFLSGKGCAIKFKCAVALRKVVLVSAAAAEKHKQFWQDFRTYLPPNHGWKMHKMAASATIQELKQIKGQYPKYKAFAVIADEEVTAQTRTDKGIFTVPEFLHRLRRPDVASSCLGLSKD